MAAQSAALHADGQARFCVPPQGQLFQMRPGRKRQSQRHAHPVHHLPRVQVKGAAQEGQRLAPQAEQLGGAAG